MDNFLHFCAIRSLIDNEGFILLALDLEGVPELRYGTTIYLQLILDYLV